MMILHFENVRLSNLKLGGRSPGTDRSLELFSPTVKPRLEAHMDMSLFKVFLKSIDLIPQQQILQRHYLYYR